MILPWGESPLVVHARRAFPLRRHRRGRQNQRRRMPLSVGTRLGPYEIVAAIGSGGMGEVYRATDTNLKRAVAIKVLPASVSGDPDRLARFQREAEVLAALNHPNIAAIYGLEKTPDLTAPLDDARGAVKIGRASCRERVYVLV